MKSDKILAGAALGLRLTRRSFRRKLIMFGVSIFSSLALTATGFAAWVLSQDANQKADGSIDVATVTDKTIEMSEITFVDKNSYSFDADKTDIGDTSGRVRWDGESDGESLVVQAQWSITNCDFVDKHVVEFLIPSGIQDAIDHNYIVIPTGLTQKMDGETPVTEKSDDQKTTYYVYTYTAPSYDRLKQVTSDGPMSWTIDQDNDRKVNFTLDLTFKWGSAFGGVNPGFYYDTDPVGATVSNVLVEKNLRQLKLDAHSVTPPTGSLDTWDPNNSRTNEEFEGLFANNTIPNYLLRVTATVK